LAIFLLVASTSFCQTTEFVGRVLLKADDEVYKTISVPNCPQKYGKPKESKATYTIYETKYTKDKTEIVVRDTVRYSSNDMAVDNIAGDTIIILADQTKLFPMAPYSDGEANLYLDDKDKSKLYVNYYLDAYNSVKKDTQIQRLSPIIDCNLQTIGVVASPIEKLKESEGFHYQYVDIDDKSVGEAWFGISERIQVFDKNGHLDYFLVEKYDRDAKYILKLNNRGHIYYSSPSLDLGALTIPIKYRFGFSQNETKVKADASASFNIGAYAGYKFTNKSIINKAGTYTERTHFTFRAGPFLAASVVTLDSLNTFAGKVPFKKDEKQNIAILSSGLGGMVDLRGLQVGIYAGWDFGLGQGRSSWNYDGKFWLGFGFGYKITDLFALKEK
jgi:hypothetical protein